MNKQAKPNTLRQGDPNLDPLVPAPMVVQYPEPRGIERDAETPENRMIKKQLPINGALIGPERTFGGPREGAARPGFHC